MSTTAVEGQQLPPIVAPAPPTGQVAPGVSDAAKGTLTREEVDRILAGKGKEVDREKEARAAAEAQSRAEAAARAKIEADLAAERTARTESDARIKALEDEKSARLEALGKEADGIVAAWPEEDRSALVGLEPEAKMRTIRLIQRKSSEAVNQAAALSVPGGQPRPPALATSEPADYMADAKARMAARQMGKPAPK